jgi:hypothetical protein
VKIAGRNEEEVAVEERYAEGGDFLVDSSHVGSV